jgi:enoyl-CoA hydratase/carnithine racemase
MPETAIGLFCDVGGSYFLSHIHKSDPSVGLYLGITGQRVKAKDLVTWGIATHYVPTVKIPDLVKSIATEVNAGSTDQAIIDLVNKHSEITAATTEAKIPDYDEIKEIFQLDSAAAIIKRLESSQTPFAENTRKMLTKMSPLSIAVVFEQIKRGRSMSIHDVFKMEFRMS